MKYRLSGPKDRTEVHPVHGAPLSFFIIRWQTHMSHDRKYYPDIGRYVIFFMINMTFVPCATNKPQDITLCYIAVS